MLLFLLACTDDSAHHWLTCGPGTWQYGLMCLPDQEDETYPFDSATPTDSADSAQPGDSGDSADDPPDDTDTEPVELPPLVFLLAGQSNMDGWSHTAGLPPSLQLAQTDVEIFWSGRPSWQPLQPSSSGSSGYAQYFGPEVTFGRAMADAHPKREVKLIKHAVGGTDLAEYWNPGDTPDDLQGEGYSTFVATLLQGLSGLEGDYELGGMIWMQGESDASVQSWANAYELNLTRLVARVREDVGVPDLPFSAGLIDCEGLCAYRETVRLAQQAVADADPLVTVFETEDLGRKPEDPWHYHGPGTRTLGTRFAESLLGHELSDAPRQAVELSGLWQYSYSGDFTVGWAFTTTRALQITDLGQLDIEQDGLARTTDVGIWTDGGALVHTDSVPELAAAWTPLIGHHRYAATEPVVLEPGSYVIGLTTFATDWDWYVYDADTSFDPAVAYVEGRHANGATLSFPTYVNGSSEAAAQWFGPNFLFVEAE